MAEAVVEGNLKLPDGQTLDRSWLMKRRHEDQYNVVVFLWAGLAPAADLQSEIGALLEGSEQDRDLGLGLAVDQLDRLAEDFLPRVVRAALATPLDTAEGSWYFPFMGIDGTDLTAFSTVLSELAASLPVETASACRAHVDHLLAQRARLPVAPPHPPAAPRRPRGKRTSS